MAQSIRCPHCGKAYVLKPELAGKQVRCRQCQKPFTVPAANPPDDLEEPILLSLATPDPPSPTPLPQFNQVLASGPTFAPAGQEDMLTAGAVLPRDGQTVLSPVAARRRPPAGNALGQRLLERKLTSAVAAVSLGLLLLFILLFFVTGLSLLFAVPSLLGAGLAALGLALPAPKRPKRQSGGIDPTAKRIAISTGVFGLIFAVMFGIMVVAGLSGHAIPKALGMSETNAYIMVIGILAACGICFAACILTLVVSGGWSIARQYGFVRVANCLYLGASPLVFLILCVGAIASGWARAGPRVAYQPLVDHQWPMPTMHHDEGSPPGWPADQTWPNPVPVPMRHVGPPPMGPMSLPPGVVNPNDPDFYRKILAELQSSDVNHRRMAVMLVAQVPPKELREEIANALETLAKDSDDMVRSQSLRAIDVWSTGDIVPIAIHALDDSNTMVRDSAIAVLDHRKDRRAIEPLVALLSDFMNWQAAKCLEHMGAMVEDALLASYDGGNDNAKRSIIGILRAVATEKGIAKLRKIAADKSNFSLSSRARQALRMRGENVGN
jgi:hypothetical protein